jgi:long-chain acyl-CoA synthetase
LTETPFTVENELMTPTFKLKRNDLRALFKEEIKVMYGGAKLQGE